MKAIRTICAVWLAFCVQTRGQLLKSVPSIQAAALCITILGLSLIIRTAAAAKVELLVNSADIGEEIDLTRYSLGQGGLSDKPMFDAHIAQIAELAPKTIRLFVQEFFDLYPERGVYHWDTLDKSIEACLATGAKPLLSLCFKPRVLYPKIDQSVVHPSDYQEWENLIVELVKHCNQARKFGIEYWEVGNEPDIGEDGGCPYRFTAQDYVTYYTHTAGAIHRADPTAKVGGPALAGYRSALGDALIEHCAKGNAPLDFFSWHVYANDPRQFQQSVREVKGKLARYPQLAKTETILDEWNMSLGNPVLASNFQPAFVLETTHGFYEAGLSRAAYYHIRDFFVDRSKFSSWMSVAGTDFVAHWWNVMPQYDGLYDNQGRVRPAYYAFRLMSLIKGQKLGVRGTTPEIKAFAAQSGNWTQLVFWNFSLSGQGEPTDVVVRFPESSRGQFRFMKLNAQAAVNNLEIIRYGNVNELESQPIATQLEPNGIGWIEVSR